MLAVLGDTVSMLAEIIVAPGRPVTANNIDLPIGPAKFGKQIVEQVELLDVIVLYIAGAVVPQEMVQLRNALLQVVVAHAVDHIDVLTGMQMVET
jgi:hypothetical protein